MTSTNTTYGGRPVIYDDRPIDSANRPTDYIRCEPLTDHQRDEVLRIIKVIKHREMNNLRSYLGAERARASSSALNTTGEERRVHEAQAAAYDRSLQLLEQFCDADYARGLDFFQDRVTSEETTMGLFSSKESEVKAAEKALHTQHDDNRKALRAGDRAATAENLRLQRELADAERRAQKGGR